MDDNGSISKSKRIESSGRRGSGDDFCGYFLQEAEAFISLDEGNNRQYLLRILLEIARNIFDHAGGRGYLELRESRDGRLEFEIGNSDGPVLREEEAHNDSGAKSWNNGGAGLGREGAPGMIFAYAKSIGLHLNLDIPRGYVYRGVLRK